MINPISIKCPECAADLEIEEGRRSAFCTYCGAKIILHNENEYIIRNIDEAEVKKAENDSFIKLKQIEIAQKDKIFKIKLSLILAGGGAFLSVIGFALGNLTHNPDSAFYFLGIIGMIAMLSPIYLWMGNKKDSVDEIRTDGKIKIPDNILDIEGCDYRNLQNAYLSLGFINVSVVNLKDIKVGIFAKPGIVEEVTINGSEPLSGYLYDSKSTVIITYHDF